MFTVLSLMRVANHRRPTARLWSGHDHIVLIPGAGGVAWYWSRLVPLLEQAGHAAVAVDLPGDDERPDCPNTPTSSSRQSATATTSCWSPSRSAGSPRRWSAERIAVRELVFVNAMIPVPGETPDEWWAQRRLRAGAHRSGRGGRLHRPSSTSRPTSCTTSTRGRGRGRAVPAQRGARPPSTAGATSTAWPDDPDPRARRRRRPVLPGRLPAPGRPRAARRRRRRAARRSPHRAVATRRRWPTIC